MRPGLYGGVKGVPRALCPPLWLGLPVPKHLVVPGDLPHLQGAVDQTGVCCPGLLAGVVWGEVPQEADPVPHSVEPPGMSPLHVPAPALIDQAVSADQKTETKISCCCPAQTGGDLTCSQCPTSRWCQCEGPGSPWLRPHSPPGPDTPSWRCGGGTTEAAGQAAGRTPLRGAGRPTPLYWQSWGSPGAPGAPGALKMSQLSVSLTVRVIPTLQGDGRGERGHYRNDGCRWSLHTVSLSKYRLLSSLSQLGWYIHHQLSHHQPEQSLV